MIELIYDLSVDPLELCGYSSYILIYRYNRICNPRLTAQLLKKVSLAARSGEIHCIIGNAGLFVDKWMVQLIKVFWLRDWRTAVFFFKSTQPHCWLDSAGSSHLINVPASFEILDRFTPVGNRIAQRPNKLFHPFAFLR